MFEYTNLNNTSYPNCAYYRDAFRNTPPPTLKLTKVGNRHYNLYSRRFKKNIKPSS